MNIKHNQKTNTQSGKFVNTLLFILFSILAVILGIQCGDIWYKLDVDLVNRIDAESFKNVIKVSMPIIESVYNSGKSSVSFSGEVKELLAKVFNFDLDAPATILNAQSPLFMNYYNLQQRAQLSHNDVGNVPGSGIADESPVPDNRNDDGYREDGNPGEMGKPDGAESPGAGTGYGESNRNDLDEGGRRDDSTGNDVREDDGTGSGQSDIYPQPVSSIAFEEDEDEDEQDSDLVASNQILVRNFTKHQINIDELLKKPLKLDFSKKGPKVLIYHTHTSESYILKESDLGKKDVPSFSSNPRQNVVRVGEELARELKKRGIETLHNGTVHDKHRSSAYSVSIETLKSYQKSHPSIQVFIDLHRDGLDETKKLRLVKEINGKNAAQIMFVVGADGSLPHSEWKENLKFVLKLQQKLNEKYPGLARPVWIVAKRYNQQVSNQAILVEVGGDGNLLSECFESTKYLAEVLEEVMAGK